MGLRHQAVTGRASLHWGDEERARAPDEFEASCQYSFHEACSVTELHYFTIKGSMEFPFRTRAQPRSPSQVAVSSEISSEFPKKYSLPIFET